MYNLIASYTHPIGLRPELVHRARIGVLTHAYTVYVGPNVDSPTTHFVVAHARLSCTHSLHFCSAAYVPRSLNLRSVTYYTFIYPSTTLLYARSLHFLGVAYYTFIYPFTTLS